jgi:hypothetical protein
VGERVRAGEMRKHFVVFFSPGTLFAEQTEKPIESWDVDKAVKLAKSIKERYDARPYGFQFITKARSAKDLDSKVIERSGMYFLGGKVETIQEIEARNDPKEEILRSNMRSNGFDKVVVNDNSWRWTQPLGKNDKVLKVTL